MDNISIENLRYHDQSPPHQPKDASNDVYQNAKEEMQSFTGLLTPKINSLVLEKKHKPNEPGHLMRVCRQKLDYRIIHKQSQTKQEYLLETGQFFVNNQPPNSEEVFFEFCDNIRDIFDGIDSNQVELFEEPRTQ